MKQLDRCEWKTARYARKLPRTMACKSDSDAIIGVKCPTVQLNAKLRVL